MLDPLGLVLQGEVSIDQAISCTKARSTLWVSYHVPQAVTEQFLQ